MLYRQNISYSFGSPGCRVKRWRQQASQHQRHDDDHGDGDGDGDGHGDGNGDHDHEIIFDCVTRGELLSPNGRFEKLLSHLLFP